jgi:hypothetical protein
VVSKKGKENRKGALYIIASILTWGISLALPYVIIYVMTGFRNGNSTVVQRVAVLGWLVAGQSAVVFEPIVWRLWGSTVYGHWFITAAILLAPLGVWSVVIVSKMILASGICSRL